MRNIGAKIRKLREEKGLSQEKLVAKGDLSRYTLYLIETGKTDNPSIKILNKIAIALGTTIEELVKEVNTND